MEGKGVEESSLSDKGRGGNERLLSWDELVLFAMLTLGKERHRRRGKGREGRRGRRVYCLEKGDSGEKC